MKRWKPFALTLAFWAGLAAMAYVVSALIAVRWAAYLLPAVLAVAGRRHDLVGLRVVDPREVALPPTALLTVENAESGLLATLDGRRSAVREQYAQAAAETRRQQERAFRRAGVDLIDIRCGEDCVRPLMEFFRRRERRR